MNIRISQFIKNFVLNLIGCVIPIVLLQLYIYPQIAQEVGGNQYGRILSMIGLLTLVAEPLGSALNNSRLILQSEYEKKDDWGDSNLLLLFSIPINIISLLIMAIFYMKENEITTIILLVIISSLLMMQKFYSVYFRIQLDYMRSMICSVVLCAGYIMGLIVFKSGYSFWWIYIIGYAFGLAFVIWRNPLVKEPCRKTSLFYRGVKINITLVFVEFSNSFIKYADRLLLYPLLGGNAVSIYYAASIISKMIAMAVSPMSTVILSYLSKINKIGNRVLSVMLGAIFMVAMVGYFLCIFISKPILMWLYPHWYTESLAIVNITTATAVIDAIGMIVRPIILRYKKLKFQYVISLTNLILYVFFAYSFYFKWGLKGFCIGILFNSIIQLIIKILIVIRTSNSYIGEL